MFATILALLPKVGPIVASLPEFAKLIDQVGDMLGSDDQETLQSAYELAKQNSDAAHADLQALVAEKLE